MCDPKDKNEPGRFLGEGVSYRAKLIGVLEVPEARGDTMCQEALADLKMAIRAAGEHKQRIQIHVAIDGLRLRDDKTGDCLYHHPVHKISFIAQDMTDSRAFGYIFGSPDSGHRFFGIKTDKAASQVVIAMRDLFQVVFELKKKEVEIKKQQVEGKSSASALVRHTISTGEVREIRVKTAPQHSIAVGDSPSVLKDTAEGGVADLVDLEQELCSLRRGLIQVEGLTPSADPFGDSFAATQKVLIPPPPSGSSTRGRNTPATTSTPTVTTTTNVTRSVFSPNKTSLPFDLPTHEYEPSATALVDSLTETPVAAVTSSARDVFTELDPLGTGRSKPYVDKKLFFQELKNPPKKVLKDLVTKDIEKDFSQTLTSLSRQSGGSVKVSKPFPFLDPFANEDPFDTSDPFDSFKEDPFIDLQEYCLRSKLGREGTLERSGSSVESVRRKKSLFNGPLQVSLPPEPTPKSPRLTRQSTDTSSIRQRPQPTSKLSIDNASPPPPLPPKKIEINIAKAPPRPPQEYEETDVPEPGPPLPRPARKKEPMADRSTKPQLVPQLSSIAATSSEDEYLCPAPPPLPNAKRFDITLSQLLVCTMPELSARLRVPASTLSSMTLPKLTEYLRSYLAADNERAHIHVEPPEKDKPVQFMQTNSVTDKSVASAPPLPEFTPQFEDNFTPADTSEFVANFDDFEQKASSSYDRYAAFREIQEQELKSKSILDPIDNISDSETKQDSDGKEELTAINERVTNGTEPIETSRSPLKSLDELTLDSFNMFRSSVSPKPTQIEAKIEDIKSVMKTLQIETSRRSVSPRENNEEKQEDASDKYAALREITITEPQDEFESLPPEVSLPKERKRSDEKSDGFDNSDFFDCIDNSSLSFSHVEDAFRKSPSVKEKEEDKKEEVVTIEPIRDLQPPARLSTGSFSDVASASSPDTKDGRASPSKHWSMLSREPSPPSPPSPPSRPSPSPSSDSDLRPAKPGRLPRNMRPNVQTSSSSRDASPWEEEPPPIPRLQRPPSHRDRESRHNSSGSRECLDSGSGRDKDKKREKRERERGRDISRESRDRRDSGSGRDRRDSKERELREQRETRDRRDRRSRERENDTWERDRSYRERDYRDTRSRDRDRNKEYMARDKDRDRHRKRRAYEDDDYSDGCGSGRSSPRDRWSDTRRRRDDRNYGSLGWRESRRRNDIRLSDDPADRRYGTVAWPARRASSRRDTERDRDVLLRDVTSRDVMRDRDVTSRDRDPRDSSRRRSRREQTRTKSRDYRFSNDFSPREREASPFETEFPDTPASNNKRTNYSTLEGTRFAFEPEDTTASPLSAGSMRARDGDSPATRFRFDSDSISPRSMFEDDFTAISTPRCRTASIAEEDEEVPPLRAKPQAHRDIKKSESVNIFTKEVDPFEGDDFFACTGSDRVARRENWPGDFQGFDNA